MAIKDSFNRYFPADKTEIARFGRFAIVRGTFPTSKGLENKYGMYVPGADAVPYTDDGIVLTFEEIKQLSELLPALISSGIVRKNTPAEEYTATMEAIKAGKKAPTLLW